MTQSDGWQSPYDPPKPPSTPAPASGAGAPEPLPAPDPAEPLRPDQQPYPGQPYLAQPYPAQSYPGQPYPSQPYPGQPYPGQPYQYAGPSGYGAPLEKNSIGVWSLVLGIVSLVLLFSCGIGFLAGIPAVITGHLSRRAQREGQADNGGLGLAGIIMGWVAIGLTILVVAGFAVLFSIPEFREGFFGSSSGY